MGWIERTALKHTLPYIKEIVDENLLYDVGSSNPVLCDYLEGWDGMGSEREFQEGGDVCMPMASLCWYMAETNTINCKEILKMLVVQS